MKTQVKKCIALLLALVLFGTSLAGCAFIAGEEYEESDDSTGPVFVPEDETEDGIIRDGRLSISFVPEDALNPYTSTSRDNLAVSGLIYEGLFALDEAFTAIPVLAENISTVDGSRFLIEIKSGVTFHNGAALTAADVIYSMNRARRSALFSSRLEIITDYNRVQNAEGETSPYAFEILINRVHGNLPVLLTFPIIQSGTGYNTVPPGTGPFFHPYDEGLPRLEAFSAHRYRENLPIDTIYLAEIGTVEQLTAHFNSGLLDIVALDPTTTGEPRIAGTRELRQVEASMIDFIGFNVNRPETGRLEVRQAISRAIDRAYITENIMRGNAVSSTLPIHPILPFYDEFLALQHEFDLEFAREMLAGTHTIPREPEAEREEQDPEDGSAEGGEIEEAQAPRTRLTLLVASGNTMRLDVASFIATNISALGYQVEILDVPYTQFMDALRGGNFDLFYGQVRLQPDFDLSPILHGELAFGGIEGLVSPRVIDDFLASMPSNRGEMATAMGAAIFAEAPIATIGFRNLAVATQRGVVAGLSPTQDNVYHNVWDWLLDL